MSHPEKSRPAAAAPSPGQEVSSSAVPARDETPRRGFLAKFAAIVIGGIATLIPLAVSVFALFDPARKRNSTARAATDGAQDGFFRVTNLAALPADGVPRFFRIIADRDDAWTHFANQPVGSLYLVRSADDAVRAYNATCPHLGCLVGFVAAKDAFLCPCHNSYFSLTGDRSPDSPSPRNLDEMPSEIRDDAVWVKYHDFRTGTAEKISIA